MIQNIELDEYLWDLLEGSSREIKNRIEKGSDDAEMPLFFLDGKPIIHCNTINAIQGQAGVHKSRFIQAFAAAVLSESGCNGELGLTVNKSIQHNVIYVDTERNIKFRFPNAMRETLALSGLPIDEIPSNFDPRSILKIPLKERLNALKMLLNRKKNDWSGHILVILDVLTDCVEDLNYAGSARELLNFLGGMCDDYNCTFLCTIHENPKSEKATGFVGTELLRKSTAQIAIKELRKKTGKAVYQVESKKSRVTSAWGEIYFSFDEDKKILVRESSYEKEQEEGPTLLLEQVVDLLEDGEMNNTDLCSQLVSIAGMAFGTLVKKVRALVDKAAVLPDGRSVERKQVGKDIVYFIKTADLFDESLEQEKLLEAELLEEEI